MGFIVYVMLALGVLGGGALTLGFQKLFLEPKAIERAVENERRICDGRIAAIGQKTAEDALGKVDGAKLATEAMTPTPDTREGILAFCAKDKPTCRNP